MAPRRGKKDAGAFLGVRLSKKTYQRLQELAEQEYRSVSDQARRALEIYLDHFDQCEELWRKERKKKI